MRSDYKCHCCTTLYASAVCAPYCSQCVIAIRAELAEAREKTQKNMEWARTMRQSYESELVEAKAAIHDYTKALARSQKLLAEEIGKNESMEAEVAALKAENARMREALEKAKEQLDSATNNGEEGEDWDYVFEARDILISAIAPPQEKPCQDCVGPDHPVCHEPDHQKPAQEGK